jgi:hypothetical protein
MDNIIKILLLISIILVEYIFNIIRILKNHYIISICALEFIYYFMDKNIKKLLLLIAILQMYINKWGNTKNLFSI